MALYLSYNIYSKIKPNDHILNVNHNRLYMRMEDRTFLEPVMTHALMSKHGEMYY